MSTDSLMLMTLDDFGPTPVSRNWQCLWSELCVSKAIDGPDKLLDTLRKAGVTVKVKSSVEDSGDLHIRVLVNGDEMIEEIRVGSETFGDRLVGFGETVRKLLQLGYQ